MGIAAVILLVALGFGIHYWRLSQLYVSTDNAYLNADRIEMAAQVSGPVIRIWVQDQQAVRRGDLLLEIDPQPYQLAVDAAEAQLELSYQSSSQDRAAVAAARATVEQRTAELRNAQSTEQRAIELTKQKLISKQSAETTATEAHTAAAAVQRRAGESRAGHQRAGQGRRAERRGARGGGEARAGQPRSARIRESPRPRVA